VNALVGTDIMKTDTPRTDEVARKWIREQKMVPDSKQAVCLLIKTFLDHARVLEREINRECAWTRDGDGCYYVKCRDIRVLMPRQRDADDNADHNFMFCPYCGGRIHVSSNPTGHAPARSAAEGR